MWQSRNEVLTARQERGRRECVLQENAHTDVIAPTNQEARQERGRHEWVLQENAHKDMIAPPTNQEASQERGRHEWVQNNIKFGHSPRLRTWWFVMVWGEPRDPQPWRSSHDVGDFRRFLAAHMQSQLQILQSNWLRFRRTGNSFPMLGTAGTIIFDTFWYCMTFQYIAIRFKTCQYISIHPDECNRMWCRDMPRRLCTSTNADFERGPHSF